MIPALGGKYGETATVNVKGIARIPEVFAMNGRCMVFPCTRVLSASLDPGGGEVLNLDAVDQAPADTTQPAGAEHVADRLGGQP